MASDTLPPASPPPSQPTQPQQPPPKTYTQFSTPPPSANTLPEGSGQNTAGAHTKIPSFTEGIKTIRIEDFKQVHMYPCVRESLLFGIGGGFGVGGVRALWGANFPKAANWAVGTFAIAAFANYEYCLFQRRKEKAQMKRAVEIISSKRAEKEEAARLKREERRRLKEEEDKKNELAGKRGKGWFW